MYCDERVVRFPVQWRGNCYFSLATLLTANKKVSELYQEYQMQIAFLTNGTWCLNTALLIWPSVSKNIL